MRLLIITNYYPPSKQGGGYAQLCEEVVDGLAAKGHTVTVLTSIYGDGAENRRPYPVHRLLSIDPDWHSSKLGFWQFSVGRRKRERQAVAQLRQLVAKFRPDVIFVWHILGLSRLMLQMAEQLPGIAVAYYLADYVAELPDEYIDYWQLPPVHWTAKLLKRPLTKLALYILAREGKPILLRYENAICVSDYLRRRLVSQGLISARAVVIHNGVNLLQFTATRYPSRPSSWDSLQCLIAGRVVVDKGVHTVIEALGLLKSKAQLDGIRLTILGDGPVSYLAYLHERISHYQLQMVVEFRPPVLREQMSEVLAGFDVLILPSEYAEPLARAIQEAMAMGLLVIGTTTGGSGELLVHEATGLVFEAGNPASLAQQLVRATTEPELVVSLAESGRQAIVNSFNIQRTIDQVETYLASLVDDHSKPLMSGTRSIPAPIIANSWDRA